MLFVVAGLLAISCLFVGFLWVKALRKGMAKNAGVSRSAQFLFIATGLVLQSAIMIVAMLLRMIQAAFGINVQFAILVCMISFFVGNFLFILAGSIRSASRLYLALFVVSVVGWLLANAMFPIMGML